jgi:hypothetical protein
MPPEPATQHPFPPRTVETYRADSVAEEHAFLQAYPPAGGEWELVSQTLRFWREAPQDHLTVRAAGHGEVTVPFDVSSFFGAAPASGDQGNDLDRLLETALDFARANGPHHPGSLPRFPIPSTGYPGRVEVPMALVAVDNSGRRGLYAPPRIVVLTYPAGEPVGVGEAEGFDPGRWPPRRLGDWPPPAMRRLDQGRLQAMITRFSAIWGRLLTAWLTSADYSQRPDEGAEALALLGQIEAPAMLGIYERMNPHFWRWLSGS